MALLSTLPLVVVDLIWRFTLSEKELNPPLYFSKRQDKGLEPGGLPEPFVAIASVCKEWFSLVVAAASERVLGFLTLDFREVHVMNRKTLVEMRRRLTLQRAPLQQLKFNSVPVFNANSDQFWSSLLSLTPNLHLLNLDDDCWTAPSTDHLAVAVRAAGIHCPKITEVPVSDIMKPPRGYDKQTRGNAYRLDFARMLFQSSAASLKIDPSEGGLRRFRISMASVFKHIATGSRFLREIADFCPNIQVLDGYESVIPGVNLAMCSERWMADLASWRYFCMRCTQLTQFDWLCVPFATKFFEIFGQTPKPQLRKLTMTSAHNWKWSRHLEQVSTAERDELKSSGYARTAKDALKVLDACPAVEELQMK